MPKKRTSNEVVEGEKDTSREHSYVKFPREELIPISKNNKKYNVDIDIKKLKREWEKRGRRKYTTLHTHSDQAKESYNVFESVSAMPSAEDLYLFVTDKEQKTEVISQIDDETGKEMGRLYVRKTKKTPSVNRSPVRRKWWQNRYTEGLVDFFKETFGPESNLLYGQEPSDIDDFRILADNYGTVNANAPLNGKPEELRGALDEFTRRLHLKYKFIPSKGYELNKSKTSFKKIGEPDREFVKTVIPAKRLGFLEELAMIPIEIVTDMISGIPGGDSYAPQDRILYKYPRVSSTEKLLFIFLIVVFLAMFSLNITNLTGFTITNVSQTNINFIGLAIIIFGIILLYVLNKSRKRNIKIKKKK